MIVPCLALLAAAACGPRSEPAPLRPGCAPERRPEALPAAATLVDSAALAAGLAGLWEARGRPDGQVVLSLAYDVNGWNEERRVAGGGVDPALAEEVRDSVFAHRRAVAPGEPWGVRLEVGLGVAPTLRVQRRVLCPARLASGAALPGTDEEYSARHPYPPVVGAFRSRVQLLVDAAGNVVDARLDGAPTDAWVLASLMRTAQSMSFAPARVDGVPVASWVEFTLPVR